MGLHDIITLSLPCKAEYVSTARLAASGVANRMGFDIETVEDIKVAVSEVCSKIISAAGDPVKQYGIRFDVLADRLKVTFTTDFENIGCIFKDDETGLGMSIIKAFMDEVEYCPDNRNFLLTMTKKTGVDS